jgi:XTP/dITP diphosphohydrolase
MAIWFATGNVHKKEELAAILAGRRIRVPAEDPELAGLVFDETGSSFRENALIKARELYCRVHEPVIADDSGLCVDALGGRPGIYSSRYGCVGGKNLESPERNALLLEELGDNPDRRARFVCAMILLYTPDRFFIVQETLEGEIVRRGGRGSGGFGYDPIFYLPDRGCTVAELPEAEKNRISHRGRAGKAVARILSGG